jgi:Zn-finger nucleic acid-binding protein
MAHKRSPKAGVPMKPYRLDEGIEIDVCPITKGIWLDLGELSALIGLEADLPFFREALAESRDTIWPSPVANCRLREIRFHPEHDVVIDYCPLSGGIWLDAGELDKLKQIARQLQPPFSPAVGALRSIPTRLPPASGNAPAPQIPRPAGRPLPPRPRKKA